MIARDVMTPSPTTIVASEPISRAAQLMAQFDIGALPVIDNHQDRHLVGIITDRDIVIRHVAKGGSRDCCVSDHMTASNLHVTRPDTEIHDVIRVMAHDQVRRMPVVDDDKRVIGVIAQADVARQLGFTEPQVVGDVVEAISTPHYLEVKAGI
jgi:CBS domain-containing protein